MNLLLECLCHVQKRMQTSADKSGDDEIVTCRIGVKAVRVNREQMEQLAGLPADTTLTLFDDVGMPRQRMSFLLPTRELVASGMIEHRKESGAKIAGLKLSTAVVADLRFNLDTPEQDQPTSVMSFTLLWKAAGDEVDEVRGLLNRKGCFMSLAFKEPPTQMQVPLGPQPAGPPARAGVDRKQKAAGASDEEATTPPPGGDEPLLDAATDYVRRTGHYQVSKLQKQFKVGYNRAARIQEALESLGVISKADENGERTVVNPIVPQKGSSIAELEREAAEVARRHPRKTAAAVPAKSRRH